MFDFPTYQLTVAETGASVSHCSHCRLPILEKELRVSAFSGSPVHLLCFRPKYPVAVLPQHEVRLEVSGESQLQQWKDWLGHWNSRYAPLSLASITEISRRRVYIPANFSRPLAEALKFLEGAEVCTVAAACRLWYGVAWSGDVWASLGNRDFPYVQRAIANREDYIVAHFRACLSCSRFPPDEDVKALCPRTRRVICRHCFQLPECTVFQVHEYQDLMGVSKDYLSAAGVPVRDFNGSFWIFAHEADNILTAYRERRRRELLSALLAKSLYKAEDLDALARWNFSKGRYLGAVLKAKRDSGLMALLRCIYCETNSNSSLLTRKKRCIAAI